MKFISKKNEVFLDGKIVVKTYKNKETCQIEYNNIMLLRENYIKVPKVLEKELFSIKMEYIEGDVVCDVIEDFDLYKMKSLLLWIFDFHEKTGFLRGDINLRNFILTKENKIISIDFEEEFSEGEKEIDIGKLFAFIAFYRPEFSQKKIEICKLMLNLVLNHRYDLAKIKKYYLEEIENIIKRRNISPKYCDDAQHFFESICPKSNYYKK